MRFATIRDFVNGILANVSRFDDADDLCVDSARDSVRLMRAFTWFIGSEFTRNSAETDSSLWHPGTSATSLGQICLVQRSGNQGPQAPAPKPVAMYPARRQVLMGRSILRFS